MGFFVLHARHRSQSFPNIRQTLLRLQRPEPFLEAPPYARHVPLGIPKSRPLVRQPGLLRPSLLLIRLQSGALYCFVSGSLLRDTVIITGWPPQGSSQRYEASSLHSNQDRNFLRLFVAAGCNWSWSSWAGINEEFLKTMEAESNRAPHRPEPPLNYLWMPIQKFKIKSL